MRLLRMLKLLRIARAVRIFERYQEILLEFHGTVTMVKLLVILCFLSHWMACLYGSVYDFAREDFAGQEMLHWELYVAALFWAVQTLTTVGYGNVVPQTVDERLIACMVMLLGGFMFSWIISAVASAMASDSAEMIEVEKLLSVRNFINEKEMPRPLVLRIKSYYRNLNGNNKATNREVILDLPDSIRADVNFFVYGRCIVEAGSSRPITFVYSVVSSNHVRSFVHSSIRPRLKAQLRYITRGCIHAVRRWWCERAAKHGRVEVALLLSLRV